MGADAPTSVQTSEEYETPDAASVGNDIADATHPVATTARDEMGAGASSESVTGDGAADAARFSCPEKKVVQAAALRTGADAAEAGAPTGAAAGRLNKLLREVDAFISGDVSQNIDESGDPTAEGYARESDAASSRAETAHPRLPIPPTKIFLAIENVGISVGIIVYISI